MRLAFLCLLPMFVFAQPARFAMVGDAVLTHGAYEALSTMSEEFGARMVGTEGHTASLNWLEAELVALGLEVRREPFPFPGWTRNENMLELIAPEARRLPAAALGYVGAHDTLTAPVAYLDRAGLETLDPAAVSGHVLLLAPNLTFTLDEQTLLAQTGIQGLLLTNRIAGNQLLARTSNRTGQPAPFPIFSVTQEDGYAMRDAVLAGDSVRVRMATTAELSLMMGENLIATLPGTSGKRVVVGAHFDSWDLGQGAIDNGTGVAQLLDTARLMATHSPENRHTVEFIWFDAEEHGLWGSRYHVRRPDLDSVHVMFNLDMVGTPSGLNAMGFDALVPVLGALDESLGAWAMTRPLANEPWAGSDHQPFMAQGVPAVTFYAPFAGETGRHYHSTGDTIDKIDPQALAEATALIAATTHALANDDSGLRRLTVAETTTMLREAGLEQRMRIMGTWPE